VGLGLCLFFLWAVGDQVLDGLRYERGALANGQLWRVITGHLVHASASHLALNLAGLALMVALFPGEYSRREWCLVGFASAFAISAGLWWLQPQVHWYVGLSGVLHGVLAAGALGWWRTQPRLLAGALTAVLLLKLVWEQWHGALGWSGDLTVIVDAHLYGALGGGVAGGCLMLWRTHHARSGQLPGPV
jgi:rhomboid family GlyGly-CTERM serine protease